MLMVHQFHGDAAPGQPRVGDGRAGGIVGDHHDHHRTLPLVAPGNEGSGRRRLSSHWVGARACSGAILHSVTGVWISSLALLMLLSGLPWAKFWGDYLKNVRRLTGTAVARQDWTNGQPSVASPARMSRTSTATTTRASATRTWRQHRRKTGAAIDRIVASVQPLKLAPPVAIAAARARECLLDGEVVDRESTDQRGPGG